MHRIDSDDEIPKQFYNTFAVPCDEQVETAYYAFAPSKETRRLSSEHRRSIRAEEFIENRTLGTLADLCIRVISSTFGLDGLMLQYIDNRRKVRVFYDALNVNLPLKSCYFILDQHYWKRVVLAMSRNMQLGLKKNYDWRAHGLTLKYIELVEQCPAEFWPETEMHQLAEKIKMHVTNIHIKHLEPLKDTTFLRYLKGETASMINDSSYSTITSSAESEHSEESDDVLLPISDNDDLGLYRVNRSLVSLDPESFAKSGRPTRRTTARSRRTNSTISGVLDIRIEQDSKDDFLDRYKDEENTADKARRYHHPVEDCHHIDLSFVRYFDQLVDLTIEFQGPGNSQHFESYHLNFSYRDTERLAHGVHHLPVLHTFRLINSRMDARKLLILAKALRKSNSIEVVDFSNDQLRDDCDEGLHELLHGNRSIKSLELQSNMLGHRALQRLGKAIRHFKGTLEYLGLQRNSINDAALHGFVMEIIGTTQVAHLCLNAICISKKAVLCCIVNELVSTHHSLRRLDITGIPIDHETGQKLIEALMANRKIQHLDCRDTGLDYRRDLKREIFCNRNQWFAERSFVFNNCKTIQDMVRWVTRVKQPIYLDALKKVREHRLCLSKRPQDTERFTVTEDEQKELEEMRETIRHSNLQNSSLTGYSTISLPTAISTTNFFTPHSDVNEERFLRRLQLPGVSERYYYFQQKKSLFQR